MFDPIDAILVSDQQEYEACPLKYERACGWHIEDYWRSVESGVNVYLHGANSCGKSRGGGAFDLAKCMGLDSLMARDGSRIELEVLKPPVSWGIGVVSYKLADEGALLALRTMLGRWPYHEDSVDHTFTIRHTRSKSETWNEEGSDWSKLYVYPYNGDEPEGPRLDGIRCDEPPPLSHLEALESRYKAGRRLYKSITATPIDRRTWYPILSRYPDRLKHVSEDGRMRIQAALWDNEMMPRDQVDEILRAAKWGTQDCPKIMQARLAGEHVDDSGSSPFAAWTDAWLARCRAPRLETRTAQREVDAPGGRKLVPQSYTIRVFHEPEDGDVCVAVSDHGKGISDGKHDPDEVQVYSMRYKRLVAAVSEHLGGWGNGNVSVDLCQRYNATWYPLVTGGYAEAALSAARQRNFYRVGHYRVNTKPGTEQSSLGITETVQLRNAAIGALEQAMQTDGVLIEDELTVRTLAGCVIDHNGKIVGGPLTGWHDERLVCAGVACHLLGNRKAPEPPTPRKEDRAAMIHRLATGQKRMPVRPGGPAPRFRW